MERLEEINRRLGAVQDELLKISDSDFATKGRLQAERDRLRDEARSYREDRDASRPSSELIEELKERYRQLESISKQYLNPAEASDGGFGGAGSHGPADAQSIKRSIDEGTGRAGVEQRIAHLESVLQERGHL